MTYDIGLDDKALVTIYITELKKMLEERGLSEGRRQEIMVKRRRLKNRGK